MLACVQFLVGLGAGGATFVKQLSAWTLGSIGGFSNASSRVLATALQALPVVRYVALPESHWDYHSVDHIMLATICNLLKGLLA